MDGRMFDGLVPALLVAGAIIGALALGVVLLIVNLI